MAFPFRKVTKKFFAFYKSFTYSATCSIFIIILLYHSSRKKGVLIAVRSSRTSYSFHSLHLTKSKRSVFQKGSKQSAPHSHNSATLRSAPFCSFVHTLFAFTSKLARLPLFGQSKEQCKHSQLSRYVHLLCSSTTLCGLPVSAGGPIIAVSTLFVEAAKSLPRAVNWS